MKLRTIPGKKKEGDTILLAETNGEEAVKMVDVAQMVVHWYYNEENLYPPPRYLGGKMFMSFLDDCIKEPNNITTVAQRYHLTVEISHKPLKDSAK
jgi:hypothetical protein